jgi:hypothetical protein
MMEHNQETNRVWIDREGIWSKVESIFHLNQDDERSILKVWLKETYNLDNVTPVMGGLTY